VYEEVDPVHRSIPLSITPVVTSVPSTAIGTSTIKSSAWGSEYSLELPASSD